MVVGCSGTCRDLPSLDTPHREQPVAQVDVVAVEAIASPVRSPVTAISPMQRLEGRRPQRAGQAGGRAISDRYLHREYRYGVACRRRTGQQPGRWDLGAGSTVCEVARRSRGPPPAAAPTRSGSPTGLGRPPAAALGGDPVRPRPFQVADEVAQHPSFLAQRVAQTRGASPGSPRPRGRARSSLHLPATGARLGRAAARSTLA